MSPRTLLVALALAACAVPGSVVRPAPATLGSTTTASVTSTSTGTTTAVATTSSTTTATTTTMFRGECALDLPPAPPSDMVPPDSVLSVHDRVTGEELWSLRLGDRGALLLAEGGSAYLAIEEGILAALDISSCQARWVRQDLTEPMVDMALTEAGLVAQSWSELVSVDREDGRLLWRRPFGGERRLAAQDGLVAVASGNTVTLVEADSGTELATVTADDPVEGTALASEALLVAAGSGVSRHDLDGTGVWAATLGGRLVDLRVEGPGVFSATAPGSVAALDLGDGQLSWERQVGEQGDYLSLGPVQHEELHVLEVDFDEAARLHRLAVEDGSTVTEQGFPAIQTFDEFDDALVLVYEDGNVKAHNLAGEPEWTIATGAEGTGRITRVEVTGHLIVALTSSGERF